MDKEYAAKMESLRKVYYDVKQNRLQADSGHVQEILDLGLWEARSRINQHEKHLELTEGKEADYL